MGQFLSPTLKTHEGFLETPVITDQGKDDEDEQDTESRDSLGPPKSAGKSTRLPPTKDPLSRTRSCPVPERETLSAFSEEVELWNRGSKDTESYGQTLKT